MSKYKSHAVAESGGVAVFDDVQAAVDFAAGTYGRLDIMFNNAGIGVNKPLLDHEPADYDRVVKVNQYGVFYGILAAGRKMRDLKTKGVIINTASVFAFMASPGVIGRSEEHTSELQSQ